MSKYDEILEINDFQLDREWSEQSIRYQDAAEAAAEEFAKLSALKDYYSVKSAQIELGYRTGKIATEVKITDKAVLALLESNEELIKIKKEIREQKKIYDDASALVYSMDHRKRALEQKVILWRSGYNADPTDYSEGTAMDSGNYSRDMQRKKLNEKRKENNDEEKTERRARRRRER